MASPTPLPADARAQQGGLLFLASLLVFFLTGIITFVLVTSWRNDDVLQNERLPLAFAFSTLCLVLVSGSLHLALKSIRRERRFITRAMLVVSLVGAVVFLIIQAQGMWRVGYTALEHGLQAGLAGIMFALALLHALHVIGGVAALAERWPVEASPVAADKALVRVAEPEAAADLAHVAEHAGERHQHPVGLLAVMAALQGPRGIQKCAPRRHLPGEAGKLSFNTSV